MKIFISFDFEGLAGVTNWKDTSNNIRYNRLATEQINEFLRGLYESTSDAEVVICDSHSTGDNIIYENLIGNTRLVKGYPRKYYMMQQLDSTFDGIVFFGYHAPIGIMGNMDHTYSSSSIFDIFINDKKVSEFCINSLFASYFGVPILFVYTDDVTKKWLHSDISKDISILESKKVISRYAAELYPYNDILEKLNQAGKNILANSAFLYPQEKQYNVKIVLTDTNITYGVSIIPFIDNIDDRTISFVSENPLDLYRKLMTVIMVASSVKGL